jgi:hypothetical protein
MIFFKEGQIGKTLSKMSPSGHFPLGWDRGSLFWGQIWCGTTGNAHTQKIYSFYLNKKAAKIYVFCNNQK